ncbi:MAG TPA: hypothetical protein VKM55_25605 [Candidatus Lokiarchaeia archaeon]|nr:hypothetical protein [Candidatus Lokiarchaeia archaeon]
MSDEIKAFKALLKLSPEQLKRKNVQDIQKQCLALITDLQSNGKEKLDLITTFFVKAYSIDKNWFFDVFAPFFDYLRNNKQVDIFSLMLTHKGFTSTQLAAIINHAITIGAISVFDIEIFLPRNASKVKQILLLAKLLKHVDEGIMQDTITDNIVKLLLPAKMSMDPASMMDFQFLNQIMNSMSHLAMLYQNKFPVAPIITRIGEQQGPQLAMFVLLMLSQGYVNETGIQAILADIDNEMFTSMFNNARKAMSGMLPPGMKAMAPGMVPGIGARPGIPRLPGLPGNSILGKMMARMLKFLGRFRRQ